MGLSIDYKSFSPEGPDKDKKFNRRWWEEPKETLHEAVATVITALQEAQIGIVGQRVISNRLYGNSPLYGSHGVSYSKLPSSTPTIKDRITYNLCQSVVDTKMAKITKNRPKPLFITERGNYKLKRKAQKLNQFIDGVFFQNRMRELAPIVFRDADINGTGAIHVFEKDGQVTFERVLVDEILVDEVESLSSASPRQMHRLKAIDRGVLKALFPGKGSMIDNSKEALSDKSSSRPHVSDQIVVAESWHLPSGKDAKDGLHTIVCDGGTLFSEVWDLPVFPIVFFHSARRQYGFWGQGACERLQNIQLEINKLLWVIQKTMHLAGTSKIWVEQGSKVVKEHLNNAILPIGVYTGQPPQYITPPMVQPEVYQHLMTLIQRGYEQEGISQLSAASKKPDGLDSGRALREYNDIESERFQNVGMAWEQFHLDCANVSILTARKIYEDNKKLKVKYPGSKFIETIDWKSVDMDEDKYVLQCFPVSSLPSDPAGRMATIQDMVNMGYLDQRQSRRLMDFPDVDQVETLYNSVEERIYRILDKIVDDGEFTPPDEYMPPDLARELSLMYINMYMNEGLEEEKLQLLKDFNSQISALEMQAAPPPAPPGPELPPEIPQELPIQ
jgi:hypothetical protein